MPPRGHGRRRISKGPTSGKTPGKKTTKSSSPSLTLKEILDVLNLTFDKQIGVFNGDATLNPPPIADLEHLKKTLAKLSDQLDIISEHDTLNIEEIQRRLDNEEEEEEDGVVDEGREATDFNDDELNQDEEEDDSVLTPDDSFVKDGDDDATKLTNKERLESKDEDGDIKIKLHNEGVSPKDSTTRHTDSENQIAKDGDDEKDEFIDANDNFDDADDFNETKKRKLSTDQIENDPQVRNPKSEFVTSQTLPLAAQALGLFDEANGGLHETGEEYLKKKYGVSSYPKNDLKDMLPGVIPDVDFTKAKPANQVQFTTFQTFFENFFRNFTEEDLKFLKNKFIVPENLLSSNPNYDPNLTPYLIPNLGPLYSSVWNEEENSGNYSPPPNIITKDSILPKSSSTELSDEVLESERISCGPLVSRLLSAILKDDKADELPTSNTNSNNGTNNLNSIEIDDDDSKTSTSALPEQQGWKVSSVNADYGTLEERLKRELKYIGIFMNLSNNTGESNSSKDDDDQEPDWLNPQDDEVSAELRRLQGDLRTISKRNNKRKRILLPYVEQQLAWQEYLSILDDLDKQIDQTYLKRIRVPKNKKRKTGVNSTHSNSGSLPPSVQAQLAAQSAQQAAANSGVKSLLEKRLRWINSIGPLFGDGNGETIKKYPKESIFDSIDLDEEDEEDYEDGEDLVLQEQH